MTTWLTVIAALATAAALLAWRRERRRHLTERSKWNAWAQGRMERTGWLAPGGYPHAPYRSTVPFGADDTFGDRGE